MKTESKHIQQLAQRISEGEKQALTELYRLAYPLLYRYGLRIMEQYAVETLEEVLSDFFLWIAKNHQKIGKINNFEAYMYRSIRQNLNQAYITKYKKSDRQQRFQQRTAALNAQNEPSPEQIFIAQEYQDLEQKQMQDAINQLPVYQREALHLRFYEEREYAEIARLLGTNPQVVRNYVSRAIKGLKKHFNRLNSIFL
ncbi:MAG: RNA polymerase sigma-70 factor [Saprospiraceae bacterium]